VDNEGNHRALESSVASPSNTSVGQEGLQERTDSSDRLEALRIDSDENLNRRIELPGGHGGASATSGGSPSRRLITSFDIGKRRALANESLHVEHRNQKW
jgi:hypothetical protein